MRQRAQKKPQASKLKSPYRSRRVRGPVDDLAAHVPSDWWRRIFNALYLKTDADYVGDVQTTLQEVNLVLDLLRLAPEHRVLDLCCGQGRHSLELSRRGFGRVEGVDQSRFLIDKAKRDAKRERLRCKFSVGDARRLRYKPGTFDVVLLLGNSFGYFESATDDLKMLQEISRILKNGGRLLIDVANGDYLKDHFQPRSWKWIDRDLLVCRERALAKDGRLVAREIVVNIGKGVIADQFYAERLYTETSLAKIIQEAGMTRFSVQRKLSMPSERNQDLGMMEHRIIATAMKK